MHALARSLTRHVRPVEHQFNKALLSCPTNSAKLKYRPSNLNAINWQRQQQATYYIDASQQTTKTIRTLLTQIQKNDNCLGRQPDINLLSESLKHLIESLKPGLEDDAKSQHQYFSLLRMHLSGLTSIEIDQLKQSLISSKFQCYVTESVIDDETYLEYGFSNGPPHCRNRTLLQTTDLYRLLDGLQQTAVLRENTDAQSASLTPAQAQEARDVLTDAAQFWMQSDKSLAVLQDTACRLAMALDIKIMPQTTIAAELASASSTVGWKNGQLQLDPKIACNLPLEKNDRLFARVLRDVLELLLTLKLTGKELQPDQLAYSERCKVLNSVEHITEHCKPSSGNEMLHQQARAVMKRSAQFGQIQIKPGTGGSLGHAWIAPHLSLVPNKLVPPHEIGSRYMHTGLNLTSGETTIRAWSAKFLTEKENEQIHPAHSVWHLTVPANMLRLQEAAKETIQQWQENDVPYRFVGTDPGCRPQVAE